MTLRLEVIALQPVATGVTRPEDVLRLPDGRVVASDAGAAVSELLATGGRRPIGSTGGRPNGIGLMASGELAIANIALGCLQRLNMETGVVETLATHTEDGLPLRHANYPLVDSDGGIWLSCCTLRETTAEAMLSPEADGMLVYVSPDGTAHLAAHETFPNCMAFDSEGRYLHVARTATSDIVRYPVAEPGALGEPEPYGPSLGGRGAHEMGAKYHGALQDPVTAARWGLADGCAFDATGNLWVTLLRANSLVAITPSRSVVPVAFPDGSGHLDAPTSVCWAGEDMRDIYIGSLKAPYVLKGRCSVAGAARYPPPVPR